MVSRDYTKPCHHVHGHSFFPHCERLLLSPCRCSWSGMFDATVISNIPINVKATILPLLPPRTWKSQPHLRQIWHLAEIKAQGKSSKDVYNLLLASIMKGYFSPLWLIDKNLQSALKGGCRQTRVLLILALLSFSLYCRSMVKYLLFIANSLIKFYSCFVIFLIPLYDPNFPELCNNAESPWLGSIRS